MKKITLLMVFMCFAMTTFANDMTRKARNKNIAQNGYSVICNSGDETLVTSQNGSFYLYYENWLTDDVVIYAESGQVSKEYIASKMREASSSRKIMESQGYTVYYVNMGLFSDTYYFVKTPKGNYYSVSREVKRIHADGDSLIDEL